MKFQCDKCGICCRHIENIPELKEFDSGNGRCIYLSDDNLCAIYKSRPDICNVEKMFYKKYAHQMSEEEYILLNLEGCKQLKKKRQ